MPLRQTLSTDPYMVTMTNNYSFLKLDTTNSTPLNQLVLLLYYGVPPYGEIILKKENT